MTWNKLTTKQQNYARRLSALIPHTQCPSATVSQVAKHLDAVATAAREAGHGRPIEGEILHRLCERTGWEYVAPTRKVTAREMAARLGVSLTTIYRRCRAGLLNAVKDTQGRWAITVTA